MSSFEFTFVASGVVRNAVTERKLPDAHMTDYVLGQVGAHFPILSSVLREGMSMRLSARSVMSHAPFAFRVCDDTGRAVVGHREFEFGYEVCHFCSCHLSAPAFPYTSV